MRIPKISLKRCFLIVISLAILLFFVVTLRDRDLWNTAKASVNSVIVDQSGNNKNANLEVEKQSKQNVAIEDANWGAHENSPSSSQKDKEKKKTNAAEINTNGLPPLEEDSGYRDEKTGGGEYLDLKQHDGEETNVLPWYFASGERYPRPAVRNRKTKKRLAQLLPSESPHNDRITNQLMFVPPHYEQTREESRSKIVLLFNGLNQWNVKGGREVFLNGKCPVDTCTLTDNREMAAKADLVLYKDHYVNTGATRSMNQLYMIYFLECPYHTQTMPLPDVFNWTATYRRDSDIVAPYEKWEYYDPRVKQLEQDRNYAHNKTKQVAWFVSNCNARNNRLKFAKDLAKYIGVDIYGYCGSFHCPRTQSSKCFEILDTDYKFYLAFENSNCKDYITEKFFVNALNRNVLPIVMGAPPEDYAAVAPYKSYIHVDEFESPEKLAEYLHVLDQNDELYNAYFKWKGTGEFINTYFWCRVCAMLHDTDTIAKPTRWYEDINDWWSGPGVCTKGSWRAPDARKMIIQEDD